MNTPLEQNNVISKLLKMKDNISKTLFNETYLKCLRIVVMVVCLFVCLLDIRPSNFYSLLNARLVMGAIIMTSIKYVEQIDLYGYQTRALTN